MNTATIVRNIAETHGLRKLGNRYTGPCPFCGGSKRSDKFSIVITSGGYKCYACGEKGDLVKWLRTQESLSCPDAHERAGRDCKTPETCNVADKCRFGKGEKVPAKRTRKSLEPRRNEEVVQTIPLITPGFPKLIFVQWAEAFLAKGQQRLLENEVEMQYLASRGLPKDAVERFGLGWHSHVEMIPYATIGLTPYFDEHKGKTKDKLWVPEGIILPINDFGGALHRLRVRRSATARAKSLPDLKYVWLTGSGNLPLCIKPELGQVRGAVIVEAELDAFAVAYAHPEVAVIAIGSLSAGVDPQLFKSLEKCPVILLALDAEPQSAAHITKWQNTFRHAKPWPVPNAKDPGDFYAAGGNVHEWVEAGLPAKSASHHVAKPEEPVSQPQSSPHQDCHSPLRASTNRGVGGENKDTKNIRECDQASDAILVTLSNGEQVYVIPTENNTWRELTAQGHPVFTKIEFDALCAAVEGMSAEERIKAAMAAIQVKQVFGGIITGGRSSVQTEETA